MVEDRSGPRRAAGRERPRITHHGPLRVEERRHSNAHIPDPHCGAPQPPLGGQTGSAFELGEYLNANLLYKPISSVLMGPEIMWGRRENKDGSDGEDRRVQFSLKYNFGGTILAP